MSDSEHLSDEETDIFPPTLSELAAHQTSEEYEHQIRTLRQMNATLRDNISALYAEANEMRMHASAVAVSEKSKTHMELSEDEGYSTTSIVPYIEHESSSFTERQSQQKQIDKLTKMNARLRWKLGRQKLLVSQLSANLKVASDKIHKLQSNANNINVGSTALVRLGSQSSVHTASASNTTIHYQIQSELDDLLDLIAANSARHKEYTTQLLDVDMAAHRNQVNEETVSDKIQRVIRQLRGEDNQEVFEAVSSDANQSPEHDADSTEKSFHSNLNGNHAKSQSSLDRDMSVGTNSISEKVLRCSNDGIDDVIDSNECSDGDVVDTVTHGESQEQELHDLEPEFLNHDECTVDNNCADVDSDSKEHRLQFTALVQKHNEFVDDMIDAIINGNSTEDETRSRCYMEQKSPQQNVHADEIDAVVHGDIEENYLLSSALKKEIADSASAGGHYGLEENESQCNDAGDQSDLKGEEELQSNDFEQQDLSSIHRNSLNSESKKSNQTTGLDQKHPHSVSSSTESSVDSWHKNRDKVGRNSAIEETYDYMQQLTLDTEHDYSYSNYQEQQLIQSSETDKCKNSSSIQQYELEDEFGNEETNSQDFGSSEKSSTSSSHGSYDRLEIETPTNKSPYESRNSKDIKWSGHRDDSCSIVEEERSECLSKNDGTFTGNELSRVEQPELTVTENSIRMTEKTNENAAVSDLLPLKPYATNMNMARDTDRVERGLSEKAATKVVFDYSISDLPSKAYPPEGLTSEKIKYKAEDHKNVVNAGVEYSISDLIPSEAVHRETPGDNEQLHLSATDVPTQHEEAKHNDTNILLTLGSGVTKKNGKVRKKPTHGSSANSLSVKAWKRTLSVNKSKTHQSAGSNDPLSVRLSRRQLFQQRQDAALLENHERRQLRVLVRDENGVDFVPPPLPPSLPLTNHNSPLFKKGCPDGFYKYRSSSGNMYCGYWKGGKRHGFGTAKVRAVSTLSIFLCVYLLVSMPSP